MGCRRRGLSDSTGLQGEEGMGRAWAVGAQPWGEPLPAQTWGGVLCAAGLMLGGGTEQSYPCWVPRPWSSSQGWAFRSL